MGVYSVNRAMTALLCSPTHPRYVTTPTLKSIFNWLFFRSRNWRRDDDAAGDAVLTFLFSRVLRNVGSAKIKYLGIYKGFCSG